MRNCSWIASILLLAALPAWGRPADDLVVPPPPPVSLPQAFLFPASDTGDLVEKRRALFETLALATNQQPGPGNPDVARTVMDLSEMYLAHGMVAEGLSMLDPLTEGPLAPGFVSRRNALALALGLIDPRDRPMAEPAAALLTPAYAAWEDQPLFLALDRVRAGKPDEAVPYLETALPRLRRFPEPVRAAMLPGLLDAAIGAEHWRVARDLAAEMVAMPALKDSPAYHYLLGRAAEKGGELLAAFDSYLRASEADDLWAHRARVALVEMGLASQTMTVAEARQALEQEQQVWIGDPDALATLERLAGLQIEDGDSLAALNTIGALLDRYPGTDAATRTRETAHGLIEAVYARGMSGEMPMSDFFAAHRKIAPDFRFDPAFATHSEAFAAHFRDVGATGIAADEYEETFNYLSVIRDLGLGEVAQERLDTLRLDQAETLITGARFATAEEVLRGGPGSDDPSLRDRWNDLLATLHAGAGDEAEVVATEVFKPSESYMRMRAAAYFDLGDWANAQSAYSQLFAQYGPDIDLAAAINLVLATFRNGDVDRAVELARSFPDLAARPELAEIAESLGDEAPQLLPLRRETATERLDRAAETLDRLDASKIRSN